jgi:ketosteroid isomerase-like protein
MVAVDGGNSCSKEPAMQLSPGQSFYHRLHRAIESGDLAAVESFYRPDAVLASLSAGTVLQGRAAILASIRETVEAAGPVRPVSVESFLEHGEIIGVEATQATRFAQVQTYDMYVLRTGAVFRQFSGVFSPRRPSAPRTLGAPATPEQQLYQRLWRATEAADIAALRALYRPDAVLAAVGLDTVIQGRDAIIDHIRNARQGTDPGRFKTLVAFLEAPGLIATESIRGYQFGGSGMIADTDVLGADCFLVQDGAVRYQFGNVISPRVPEIKAMLTARAAAVHRAQERSLQWYLGRRW